MARRPSSRIQKATALVPLAVLSAAWTVNVTGLGGTIADAADTGPTQSPTAPVTLPDGTPLPPPIGLNQPASVTGPTGDHISQQQSQLIVASAVSSGIPAAALAAYQRAATVIDAADQSCHLSWQLLGAIGRVESNHGRAEGNTLTAKGISTPGIFGPELNGRNGTSRVPDTDNGQLDGDTRFDRAVGPLQFIPSTWQIVAVDADGDGQRNPQDINDAALGAAVYLCSGDSDLSTVAGQRSAVFRYNHSASYVDTVLAVSKAYLAGDYSSVPNATLVNDYVFQPTTPASTKGRHQAAKQPPSHTTTTHHSGTTSGSTPPSQSPSPAPSGGGNQGGGNPGNGGTSTPPVTMPSQAPVTDAAASLQDLIGVCTSALQSKYPSLGGDDLQKAVTQCVAQLNGKTLPEAKNAVGGVVAGLADFVGNLLGGVPGGLLGGS